MLRSRQGPELSRPERAATVAIRTSHTGQHYDRPICLPAHRLHALSVQSIAGHFWAVAGILSYGNQTETMAAANC